MKIALSEASQFKPVTVAITLETEREFEKFKEMTFFSDSIPNVMAGAYQSDSVNAEIQKYSGLMREFLAGLCRALPALRGR